MTKLILNDKTELEIVSESSSEFGVTVKFESFQEIEDVHKLLTLENMKNIGITFSEGTVMYYTYKKCNGINISPKSDNGKYSVVFSITDATFAEIQMLEMQEHQMLNTSTVLATQILAQKFTDDEALTVKDIYPQWKSGEQYAIGYKTRDKGMLYKCEVENVSAEDNRPISKTSIWKCLEAINPVVPEDENISNDIIAEENQLTTTN